MQKLAVRKLLRDCRNGLRLAQHNKADEVGFTSLLARLDEMIDHTGQPGLRNPVTRVIPLADHAAILAALQLCDLVGDDNVAVVMVRGYNEDFEEFTGVYLSDYDLDELVADEDWFSDYEDPQLWVSSEAGGP